MLFADRVTLVAIRLDQGVVLLRDDTEGAPKPIRSKVESVLLDRSLSLLDEATSLGDIAAIQAAGIRGAAWDLWGDDRERSVAALQRTVLGDDATPLQGQGPLQDLAPGMTLDQLLDRDQDQP